MDADFLLFARMRQGDETAVECFVQKYYRDVLRYCNCHVFDPYSAEDLTQETFARFFLSLDRYCHRGKARAYLYAIAKNLCRDQAGKSQEIPMAQEEGIFAAATEENAACRGVPEHGGRGDPAETTIRRLEVWRAILSLPEELREVVILHYFQELKQREIAKALQIGLPLVKYRLRRARELLAERLEGRV